jgi:beta-phosphoglucomutase-like phosphatase (HAD superfamily)
MIAIFDIDGTLTESQSVDNQCFTEAFEAEFGIRGIDTDWSAYPHTTERALTFEILRRALGRDPEERELAQHRNRFLALLRERCGEIAEIPGARRFLDTLEQRGFRIALATGAWSGSARIKLRAAGFPDDYPIACCDEFDTREEIVRSAIDLAGGIPPVVLFGDAVWDVRTAAVLKLPIIGVGGNATGATVTIDDYADIHVALLAMERLV